MTFHSYRGGSAVAQKVDLTRVVFAWLSHFNLTGCNSKNTFHTSTRSPVYMGTTQVCEGGQVGGSRTHRPVLQHQPLLLGILKGNGGTGPGWHLTDADETDSRPETHGHPGNVCSKGLCGGNGERRVEDSPIVRMSHLRFPPCSSARSWTLGTGLARAPPTQPSSPQTPCPADAQLARVPGPRGRWRRPQSLLRARETPRKGAGQPCGSHGELWFRLLHPLR